MLEQADDFLAESDALYALVETMAPDDWNKPTQFKNWTTNDVIVHLHFWNKAADLSSTDEAAFLASVNAMMPKMALGMRAVENEAVSERGPDLLAAWRDYYRDMAARWRGYDPKRRLKWVGPDMSARSSISARQMETWAHGHEVFDLMGVTRTETDRISNIVRIGINTFGWSHMVNSLDIPEAMPLVSLTAPSGAIWTFGEAGSGDRIEGPALAFAQVVTQTRSFDDVALKVEGPVAEQWMRIAQCFAGPPETPPSKGQRTVNAAA